MIGGHKFDFRIYVLVTSVIDPMTVYLFKDGLVRLASEPYELSNSKESLQDLYMHLTNYSLNKRNDNFDSQKHKLRLSDVLAGGVAGDGCHKSGDQIWAEIEDIVIKTIITVQPQLAHLPVVPAQGARHLL